MTRWMVGLALFVLALVSADAAPGDTHCLALNIYYESRGEPVRGQRAVAHATLNRAEARELTVCEAVFEPFAFSWTLTQRELRNPSGAAWIRAQRVAWQAMADHAAGKRPFRGVDHFHRHDIEPTWRLSMTHIEQIGAHKFYRSE